MQSAVITGCSWENAVITGNPHHEHHSAVKTDMRVQTHFITECNAIKTGNDPRDCFLYIEASCKKRCMFLKFNEYCDYI